jgi:hypothetical protein
MARVALATELRLHLPLDAGSGTTALDRSGFELNGSLVGGAGWGEGRNGGKALALDGNGGHLALPEGILRDLGDLTIAMWVCWDAAATNARIFDFGSSDIAYMALIPRDSQGAMRFMITGTTYHGEQSIRSPSALPVGRWVHVAITLSATTGTLYVDRVPAGRNDAIDFAPFQLGATRRNWLGRSQYAADPFFQGRMQGLRLYSGAMSASEIATLEG